MRQLSPRFLSDLKNPDGVLWPVLDRVKHDHTLMLAIREDYINVYYRGGNLLRIKERRSGGYTAFFDKKYNEGRVSLPDCPTTISSQSEARKRVQSFPQYKEAMDLYFSAHNKPEREFQQLVARENNFSTISNESEYFILDIEFAEPGFKDGGRFDMLAIRWLACERRDGSRCWPALIEMKYGDGALEGSAGLIKHLCDIQSLVGDSNRYARLVLGLQDRFNQLNDLGLLTFNRAKDLKVRFGPTAKPEVIMILANHNPRSTKLAAILNSPELCQYETCGTFDLRFFAASFGGYGMHQDSILTLHEFRQLLKNRRGGTESPGA
ncbi:MAG: hypothetical protein EHM23_28400 [Acidobacteria bacterium]|nr:MAG: hypothetical protein EHM23_28400 [Acidobacteriota bacterium]